MTIPGLGEGSKALAGRIPSDVLIVLILVLSASAAFGLGFLAGKDMSKSSGGDSLWIEQLPESAVKGGGPAAALSASQEKPVEAPKATSGVYMASKNGTKYYLPTCSSSNRIKPENRVWFATKEEAEASGYGPAANCPGL